MEDFGLKIKLQGIRVAKNKARQGISIIRKLRSFLSRYSLLALYKSFLRPHLGYGDDIYDQPDNLSFTQKGAF